MQINQIKRIHPNKKRMIVARGGKRGKTAGRGGKGQSARAGNKRRPEWRDIIKRLPKLRGRGKNSNKPFAIRAEVVNLTAIEANFNNGENVTPTTLVQKGVLETYSGNLPTVKILGEGEITKSVTVSGCEVSNSAIEKIKKAGGEVTIKALSQKVTQPKNKTEDKPTKETPSPKAKSVKKEVVGDKKEKKTTKKVSK